MLGAGPGSPGMPGTRVCFLPLAVKTRLKGCGPAVFTQFWLCFRILLFRVQVNGLDTVRVPMSVVNFERPKTKRYKYWLAQQRAQGKAPSNSPEA